MCVCARACRLFCSCYSFVFFPALCDVAVVKRGEGLVWDARVLGREERAPFFLGGGGSVKSPLSTVARHVLLWLFVLLWPIECFFWHAQAIPSQATLVPANPARFLASAAFLVHVRWMVS